MRSFMRDFPLFPRAALTSARATRFGASLTLQPLPEGHVLQVFSSQGMTVIHSSLLEISDGTNHAVRAAGPGQWFVVGDCPLAAQEFLTIASRLEGRAVLVDQSHGRVRIGVSGSHAEIVLAKGTAVDLDERSFKVGQTALTLVGHISVHLTRIAPDGFEILVLRSFAEDLWNDLNRMSAEFN
jgi:sarcosine oxidase subunit gamma